MFGDTLWKIISCKNVEWGGGGGSIYSGHVGTCSCGIWTLYLLLHFDSCSSLSEMEHMNSKSVSCSFLLCKLAELELMLWKKMISIEYKYGDAEQDYTLFNII